MSEPKVISIIGGTVWGNRGAESMLVTTIGRLRESFPDGRFHVFSYYPSKDRELVSDDRIHILSCKPSSLVSRHFFGALIGSFLKDLGIGLPPARFFNIARALDESQVLLDIGGITFSDGRERYLPFNILTIWPAMMLDVPVVKMAQALGPFENRLNRLAAKKFLPRCKHIFARGERTADFLTGIGFAKDQMDTVPDLAFLYKSPYAISHENEERAGEILEKVQVDKKNGRRIVVCSPSILVDNQSEKLGLDYSAWFLDLLTIQEKEELSIVFIPNATREGSEKSHNNDLLVIQKMRDLFIQRAYSDESLLHTYWIDFDINTDSVRRFIQEGEVLVTSRFHAMISGLSLGIPTLVIGWGHKYNETMAYFDLSDWAVDFKDFHGSLPQLIQAVFENKSLIHKKLEKHLPAVRDRAELQFAYLVEELS